MSREKRVHFSEIYHKKDCKIVDYWNNLSSKILTMFQNLYVMYVVLSLTQQFKNDHYHCKMVVVFLRKCIYSDNNHKMYLLLKKMHDILSNSNILIPETYQDWKYNDLLEVNIYIWIFFIKMFKYNGVCGGMYWFHTLCWFLFKIIHLQGDQ